MPDGPPPLDRAILADNSYAQLLAGDGAISAADLLAPSPSAMGLGYYTYGASSLDLSRSMVADVATAAIFNDLEGSSTTLSDVVLRDTRPLDGRGLAVGSSLRATSRGRASRSTARRARGWSSAA